MNVNRWTLLTPPDAWAVEALDGATVRRLASLVAHWEAQDLPDCELLDVVDKLVPDAAESYPPLYLIRGELHQRLRLWDGARADFATGEQLAAHAREWELAFAFRAHSISLAAFERPAKASRDMVGLFDTLGRGQRSSPLRAHVERLSCLVLGVAGRFLDAVGHGRASLALLESAPDSRLRRYRQATLDHLVGICETHANRNAAVACEHFAAAVALYRELSRRTDVARALNGLGLLLRRTGHPAEAVRPLEEALSLASHYETRRATLINIARCRRDAGDLTGALACLRQAQALPGDVARCVEAELAWEWGMLALSRPDVLELERAQEAVVWLERASSLAEVHWPAYQAQVKATLAYAYACLRRRCEALAAWREVEALLVGDCVPEARLTAQASLVACAAQLGARRVAQARLRRLRRWSRARGLTNLYYMQCIQFPPTRALVASQRRILPAIRTWLAALATSTR